MSTARVHTKKRDIRLELANIGVDDEIVLDVLKKIKARRNQTSSDVKRVATPPSKKVPTPPSTPPPREPSALPDGLPSSPIAPSYPPESPAAVFDLDSGNEIQTYRIEILSDALVPGEIIKPRFSGNSGESYVEHYEMVPHIFSKSAVDCHQDGKDLAGDDNSDSVTEATNLTNLPEDYKNILHNSVLDKQEASEKNNLFSFKLDGEAFAKFWNMSVCTAFTGTSTEHPNAKVRSVPPMEIAIISTDDSENSNQCQDASDTDLITMRNYLATRIAKLRKMEAERIAELKRMKEEAAEEKMAKEREAEEQQAAEEKRRRDKKLEPSRNAQRRIEKKNAKKRKAELRKEQERKALEKIAETRAAIKQSKKRSRGGDETSLARTEVSSTIIGQSEPSISNPEIHDIKNETNSALTANEDVGAAVPEKDQDEASLAKSFLRQIVAMSIAPTLAKENHANDANRPTASSEEVVKEPASLMSNFTLFGSFDNGKDNQSQKSAPSTTKKEDTQVKADPVPRTEADDYANSDKHPSSACVLLPTSTPDKSDDPTNSGAGESSTSTPSRKRQTSGFSNIFSRPPRFRSLVKSGSRSPKKNWKRSLRQRSDPVATDPDHEIEGPPTLEKGVEKNISRSFPTIWGSIGTASTMQASVADKSEASSMAASQSNSKDPQGVDSGILSLGSFASSIAVMLTGSDEAPPVSPSQSFSAEQSKATPFVPDGINEHQDAVENANTDGESLELDTAGGTTQQSIGASDDEWSEDGSLASVTSRSLFSTETAIEDVWLAKMVLKKFAKSAGITVEELVEEMCDRLDALDSDVF